jgi:hypothetical protein
MEITSVSVIVCLLAFHPIFAPFLWVKVLLNFTPNAVKTSAWFIILNHLEPHQASGFVRVGSYVFMTRPLCPCVLLHGFPKLAIVAIFFAIAKLL